MYYKTKPERSNAMDDSNVNYKEKYLELMRAAEKAINILIQAQRDCEENISPRARTAPPNKNQTNTLSLRIPRGGRVLFVLKF